MNKLLLSLFFLFSPFFSFSQQPVYKQKNADVENRIKDLLKRMTLEEKILQLNQYSMGVNNNVNNIESTIKKIPAGIGSLIYFNSDPQFRNQIQKKAMEESRLGIPILFGFDVIHGFRTIYPIPLAQACSWNPSLVTQNCEMAAKESVLSGVDWTFSPMVDVARDARWGRVAEGYGEDSFVNAIFGVASVRGYQGENIGNPFSIAACLKHFVGYGMSEGGRDYRSVNISAQSLWETYLPPFKAGIQAGAATVMSGFHDINGIPASANYYTLTDILKNQWKHDGFVVSDWNSIQQLITQGVAKDKKEAGLKAFSSGVEMDMLDNIYLEYLEELLKEKRIKISQIDQSVSRILRVKFRLGLFDNPYTEIVTEQERYLTPGSRALAEKLAEESIVLLKNKENTLPIASTVKKIAVIGPLAKDKQNLIGSWGAHGKPEDVESIYEGLVNEFGKTNVLNYAKGCDIDNDDESDFKEAVSLANQSDVVIVCLGEKRSWSGENASRSSLSLPVIQEKLVETLKNTGKPIILILSNGRPLELDRLEPISDAIVELWQPGIAGGTPLAGILSGRINPSGKLAITFPLTTGQIPTYYSMRPSARTGQRIGNFGNYQDITIEPLYWFGHGLSYTTFHYSNVKISNTKIKKNQKLLAEVLVTNTGKVKGKETVLWYISDPVASISRPVKELKHFEKKELQPGESATYTFEINPVRDLSFPDATGKSLLEEGEYYLHLNNQKIKFELIK